MKQKPARTPTKVDDGSKLVAASWTCWLGEAGPRDVLQTRDDVGSGGSGGTSQQPKVGTGAATLGTKLGAFTLREVSRALQRRGGDIREGARGLNSNLCNFWLRRVQSTVLENLQSSVANWGS